MSDRMPRGGLRRPARPRAAVLAAALAAALAGAGGAAGVAVASAEPLPSRFFLNAKAESFGSGPGGGEVEAVGLLDIDGPLLLSLRGGWQGLQGVDYLRLQAGLVAVWAPGLYSEFVFGPRLAAAGGWALDGALETTLERDRWSVFGRVKALVELGSSGSLFVASLGGGYAFASWYRLAPRIYAGGNSAGESSAALVALNEFGLGSRWVLVAGGEIGVENTAAGRSWPWGPSLGASFAVSKGLKLKAIGEARFAAGERRSAALSLVADWKP